MELNKDFYENFFKKDINVPDDFFNGSVIPDGKIDNEILDKINAMLNNGPCVLCPNRKNGFCHCILGQNITY